jgi:hypothetical protein
MKIISKKDESDKNYYEELLYITSKYNKLVRTPHVKLHKISVVYTVYIVLLSIMVIGLFFFLNKSILLVIGFILCIIALIFSIYFLCYSRNYIKKELSYDGNDPYVVISSKGISYVKGSNISYKISWNDVRWILINKYSVTFIPKKNSYLIIGVNSLYKDDIIKAVINEKKTHILVDNSELYR